MMPSTNGIICRPASVADEPFTICRYSGTVTRPPNIAMPRMVLEVAPTVTVRLPNSLSGSSASSLYARSANTNATRPIAPTT